MVRGDEAVQRSVLKTLQLTAEGTLRWKAVSKTGTRYDVAQQNVIATLQKRVEYHNNLRDGGDTKDRVGSSGSSARGESPRELKRM